MAASPGAALKSYRRRRRWSYDRLATKLPAVKSTLFRIENGQAEPNLELAIAIEELTKGEIPVESWPSLAAVARLIERRGGRVAA